MWIFHPGADLTSFQLGELDPPDAQRVRAHLDRCASCRKELDAVRFAARGMRALGTQRCPVPFESIEAELAPRRSPPSPRRLAFASVALTTALSAAAASFLVARESASPRAIAMAAAKGEPTSYERAAAELHENAELALRSNDPLAVNRWVMTETGLSLALVPSDQKQLKVEGAGALSLEGRRAAVVRFTIQEGSATLLVAKAEGRRETGSKEIVYRAQGTKMLSWTRDDQTYVLVSDLKSSGTEACLACHASHERRDQIERMQRLL